MATNADWEYFSVTAEAAMTLGSLARKLRVARRVRKGVETCCHFVLHICVLALCVICVTLAAAGGNVLKNRLVYVRWPDCLRKKTNLLDTWINMYEHILTFLPSTALWWSPGWISCRKTVRRIKRPLKKGVLKKMICIWPYLHVSMMKSAYVYKSVQSTIFMSAAFHPTLHFKHRVSHRV